MIVILVALLLFGGPAPRPVEDDTYTTAVLNVSEAIAGPGSTRIFEPSRRGTFIGAVDSDTECSIGVWWSRKSRTVTPLEVTCP